MATEARETAGLIGSDKVEGTYVYDAKGENIGSIERVAAKSTIITARRGENIDRSSAGRLPPRRRPSRVHLLQLLPALLYSSLLAPITSSLPHLVCRGLNIGTVEKLIERLDRLDFFQGENPPTRGIFRPKDAYEGCNSGLASGVIFALSPCIFVTFFIV
jgi:hypothetical protein